MSRVTHVLSARVDAVTRGRLYRAARQRNAPVSTLIRAAIDAAAASDYEACAIILGRDGDAPEKVLAEIAALLGLEPKNATPDAVARAVADLMAALQPVNEPTAENADMPPLPTALTRSPARRAPVALTASGKTMTAAEFAARKRAAVRRA